MAKSEPGGEVEIHILPKRLHKTLKQSEVVIRLKDEW